MTPEISAIIKLQSLDTKAAGYEKEIAALPKHVAEIEKKLGSHIRKLEVDHAALAANQRDRKRLEDDIKVQEQKKSKLKDQMMLAKTNDQYRAFQHEIEYCDQEIRKAEDRILDLQKHKSALVEALLSEDTTKLKIDAETLSHLLAPLA